MESGLIQIQIAYIGEGDPGNAAYIYVPAVPRVGEMIGTSEGKFKIVEILYNASAKLGAGKPTPIVAVVEKQG
jgi:hypothetical protein